MISRLLFIVSLLFISITSYSISLDGKSADQNPASVRMDTTNGFVSYSSPYYVLSWAKEFPMMSFFNIESGGRSRKYIDKSLLRAGKGGRVIKNEESSFLLPSSALYEGKNISYNAIPFRDGGDMLCKVSPLNDRQFSISVQNGKEGVQGEFFRIATAPDISPVSVWADKTEQPASTQYDKPITLYTPKIIKASFKLPAVFHFPDYGLVKVEANETDVYLQEHFVPSTENVGLVLSPDSRGGHAWRKSIHHGSIVLSFHSDKLLQKPELTFTVLDENFPQIEGCDFTDSRFNGLKRCWQNNFTINPVHQTMGDNVLLEGIGHLALAFKADMLPFTPALSGTHSMNEALRTSIEVALLERIGDNGRIKDFGWESTEITLISLYNYLLVTNDWAFVQRHIEPIRRLVYGVLNTDSDNDGIFESPFHGNYMDQKRESWNWWDDFAFGHKDAYTNLHAYRALTGMEKIFEKIGLQNDALVIADKLSKFRSSFHKTFYNPQTGMYAGWISEDGRIHDYQFTFISSMAINAGLVPDKLARTILKKMLKKMGEQGYDFIYGIPGPLVSVSVEDKGPWEEMTRWGRYENGGLCGQTAYHFIQALYNVDMREQADEILFTMMATYEREYTHSGVFPGYLQSVDWRTKGGAPTGYNYLSDNYYFLLAAVTGHYGIKYPELKTPQNDLLYAGELYKDRNFDADWKFILDSTIVASASDYDVSSWRTLTLPHDFSIEDQLVQDENHIGPFVKGIKDSVSTGSTVGGIGWYRKTFTLNEQMRDKKIGIYFDGVSEHADVWINGHHLGFHPNGSTPFFYDLTPFLKPTEENVIAVRASNAGDNSRWYAGSGIYRHVWLTVAGKVHIPQWGVQITTPKVDAQQAEVKVTVPIKNEYEHGSEVTVKLEVIDPIGKIVATKEESGKILAGDSIHFDMWCNVDAPKLWSLEEPNLYNVRIQVSVDGKVEDFYQSDFGIRSLNFSASKGLLINGQPVILKGACIHHDNGLLGAATYDKAELRKIQLLKNNGFNAIRTSHNPMSKQLMDYCDRLGILVINEAFDMWKHPKRDNDYSNYFDEYSDSDITSLVLRDRNHPSVIMWSIGNEIYERADSSGLAIAERLIAVVKSLDTTRPVTQAICDFWEQKDLTWDASVPAYTLLDVGGYNYGWEHYDDDHKLYPDRIMVGTETFAREALINWRLANSLPYLLGNFVWTGIDYIGEVGIGNAEYTDEDKVFATPTRSWPWYISGCGDLDICGNKKPQSFYRDVVWGRSELEILVHEPTKGLSKELISKWGWTKEFPHWNWQGHEGAELKVNVYSTCDSVELSLNNKILGKREVDKANMTATFTVPYTQGTLTAIGVKDGKRQVVKNLKTSGAPARIKLTTDHKIVLAEPNDLSFIRIEIVDELGNLVPDAAIKLKIEVEGNGTLLASGNAATDDMASFRNSQCFTHQGLAQAILQPETRSGTMKLKVQANGLPSAEIEVEVRSYITK